GTARHQFEGAGGRAEPGGRRPRFRGPIAGWQLPRPMIMRAPAADPNRRLPGPNPDVANWAYVLARFPLLSETFILREMQELERLGHSLTVFPLQRVTDGPRHGGVNELRAPIRYQACFSPAAIVYWLRRKPGAALRALGAGLWHNRGDARLWLGALAYWPKALGIAREMRQQKIEHAHAHYVTHPAFVAYVVNRLTGIPYSVTIHAHDLYCHRAMLRQKVQRASQVVTISEYNRRWLEHALHASSQRSSITVVRCGVAAATFESLAAGRTASSGLRVLSVGSLQPYKGHRHLIAACAELGRRGVAFDCRIVGGGRLEDTLQRQIERARLGNWVRLEGPQTEAGIRTWLRWANVFALASVVDKRTGQMEGIPVALMEAMAAGLAVVASNVSGIAELVQEGEGLLVAAEAEDELAAALLRLRDAGLRRRLGTAAQRHIRAEYDLQVNVAQLARRLGWSVAPGEATA
ncbi:MAG: glycosyltransferase family 4 protein, partial [Terriglobales bacterium]